MPNMSDSERKFRTVFDLFIQVTSSLNGLVRMTCDLEGYTVAVERVNEYADCPQEVGNTCMILCMDPDRGIN